VTFTSSILPPYLRRSKSLDELIPWLYLKGISTGDFSEALQALVGPQARGLSANVVVKLLEQWQREYGAWQQRELLGKQYVYLWVDGIYVNVRLTGERQCFLVVMGATADGIKELVAVQDGIREDKQSWHELLVDLKHRGLTQPPKLVVGDGALGFWKAVEEVWPEVRQQRCWMHKAGNVLSKLPKSLQPQAKHDLQAIWLAETKQQAEKAFTTFLEKYAAKYPKATDCLAKDREALLTFYDFPAEHWSHLRTTNPIESTFSTIRHRHRRTKGNGTAQACRAMIFKLAQSAERHWRRLNKHELILPVLQGKKFIDGLLQDAA
jgi:transposase-like protein